MTTRAIGYVRCSRPPKNRPESASDTLDAQAASIRAYCTFKGLDLVDVVEDEAVSGGKPLGERPGGARVLASIDAGVNAVVAMKLDRLFRSTTDALTTTQAWDRARVSMHLVDQGGQSIDTSTTLGRFMLTMFAAMGEMERGLTGDRTRAVFAHKRSKGERASAVAPYGKRFVDGLIVDDESEQQAIRQILAMRAAGVSVRGIVAALEAAGTPARGGAWHVTTVARILEREKEQA